MGVRASVVFVVAVVLAAEGLGEPVEAQAEGGEISSAQAVGGVLV